MIFKDVKLVSFYAAIVFLGGCQQKNEIETGEGYIPVDGGKVWYQVVGSGDKTPMVVLHGGPGVPSYYLNPMKELGKDRKLIFYHQLGCGKSGSNTDTSLMTVDHFVDELKTVVDHFGLKEFYLYGHSWGTMLATDYYLKYPQGIKAIILSSPCISIPLWMKDADTLLATLPANIQQVIQVNEQRKTYTDTGYQKAVQVYYENFISNKLPWSADIDSSFQQIGKAYDYMWGPSEFTVSGTLHNYDRTNRLKEFNVPTLFVAGEFDEARPATVKYFQSLVPGAKLQVVKGSAHITMQDKPAENNKVIRDFINGLEK